MINFERPFDWYILHFDIRLNQYFNPKTGCSTLKKGLNTENTNYLSTDFEMSFLDDYWSLSDYILTKSSCWRTYFPVYPTSAVITLFEGKYELFSWFLKNMCYNVPLPLFFAILQFILYLYSKEGFTPSFINLTPFKRD